MLAGSRCLKWFNSLGLRKYVSSEERAPKKPCFPPAPPVLCRISSLRPRTTLLIPGGSWIFSCTDPHYLCLKTVLTWQLKFKNLIEDKQCISSWFYFSFPSHHTPLISFNYKNTPCIWVETNGHVRIELRREECMLSKQIAKAKHILL